MRNINPNIVNMGLFALGLVAVSVSALLPLDTTTTMEVGGSGLFMLGLAIKRFGDLSPRDLEE